MGLLEFDKLFSGVGLLQGAKIVIMVVQSLAHVWLCNPTGCSTPVSPVLSPRVCSDSCQFSQ